MSDDDRTLRAEAEWLDLAPPPPPVPSETKAIIARTLAGLRAGAGESYTFWNAEADEIVAALADAGYEIVLRDPAGAIEAGAEIYARWRQGVDPDVPFDEIPPHLAGPVAGSMENARAFLPGVYGSFVSAANRKPRPEGTGLAAEGCARCVELERELRGEARPADEIVEAFAALVDVADGWFDDASVCWSEEATAADQAILDRARRALEAIDRNPGGTR